MNIFYVDKDPKIAAKMMCDKHIIKMILESAQMLCTAKTVQRLKMATDNLLIYKEAWWELRLMGTKVSI